MFILRIAHEVHDYDRWKAMFDSDPADRKGSGVRRYRITRSVADSNRVTIDLEFDDLAAAEAMHETLKGVWAGPGAALMIGPQAEIIELTDSAVL